MSNFHVRDCLLDCITYEELITAVCCNEPEINEAVIRKVADHLLQFQLEAFQQMLDTDMDKIIDACRKVG